MHGCLVPREDAVVVETQVPVEFSEPQLQVSVDFLARRGLGKVTDLVPEDERAGTPPLHLGGVDLIEHLPAPFWVDDLHFPVVPGSFRGPAAAQNGSQIEPDCCENQRFVYILDNSR